jgi:8-oxo-dGTP pyrophosphatase MutT (NUDIX family)
MKLDLVVAGYMVDGGRVLLILHNKLKKWLPPGGHIEGNETPDDAVLREFREEVNIDAEILGKKEVAQAGNIRRQLALPFYANVHSVGDHDHCCLYYLCSPKNPEAMRIQESEVSGAKWFSPKELESEEVAEDVRNIAKLAMKTYNGLKR